ncbi:hypothetical protein HS088_TW13G01314 [Tripterygium wilfordii]|uniref:Uncharacterized protein n=1 Tax=Tripterygium wilfordii TaxID=458696 RepID=A0A7J7CWB0_TRIWF|nr:hypothetical protein HS088_TW13G01314 [Tripterygium wilfordii]
MESRGVFMLVMKHLVVYIRYHKFWVLPFGLFSLGHLGSQTIYPRRKCSPCTCLRPRVSEKVETLIKATRQSSHSNRLFELVMVLCVHETTEIILMSWKFQLLN